MRDIDITRGLCSGLSAAALAARRSSPAGRAVRPEAWRVSGGVTSGTGMLPGSLTTGTTTENVLPSRSREETMICPPCSPSQVSARSQGAFAQSCAFVP